LLHLNPGTWKILSLSPRRLPTLPPSVSTPFSQGVSSAGHSLWAPSREREDEHWAFLVPVSLDSPRICTSLNKSFSLAVAEGTRWLEVFWKSGCYVECIRWLYELCSGPPAWSNSVSMIVSGKEINLKFLSFFFGGTGV
jgi:hypothetical protein